MIRANGLDLNLFQFDYDQTWCVMFLNADRTIYGRYGTRAGGRKDADTHISVPGFKKAMQRALETHADYPANRRQLAAFTGPPVEFSTPDKIPTQRAHECIHCHQVHDALLRHKWERQKLKAADLFVYPLPEQIGLRMHPNDCLVVARVSDGSPAAQAGLREGDRILRLNGAPLLSQADIQWLLHRADSKATLPVTYQRDGRTAETALALSGNWKAADLSWRESSWLGLRHAVRFDTLSAEKKQALHINRDAMAFEVGAMYGSGPEPLRQAGLRIGDVVIGINGRSDLLSETDFLVYLRLTFGPGDKIPLRILRSGKELNLDVPAW